MREVLVTEKTGIRGVGTLTPPLNFPIFFDVKCPHCKAKWAMKIENEHNCAVSEYRIVGAYIPCHSCDNIFHLRAEFKGESADIEISRF